MTGRGARRIALVAGATALVLALGVGVGSAIGSDGGSDAAAAPSTVDIGFSQDMIVHHEQAVLMAQLVRNRTKDPKVAALAAGIEADQLLDIGALRGYLALWGASVLPSGPPMTWMATEHGHHGDAAKGMPGMATTAQLDALRRATGDKMDAMFLRLMWRHHEGGQGMTADAGARAAVPAVQGLASRMAYHQREETQTLVALLRARGLALA